MIISVGSKVKDESGKLYLLKEEIGHGGFGCVYKAVREEDGAIFAVKTLMYSFNNPSEIETFKNEIALAPTVYGDNIIKYTYAHDGTKYSDLPPYIIMEYADGGTLRELLEKRKASNEYFTKDELVATYNQLISGMKIINSSLVHRDIKPENILICDSKVKISDFGLSKIAEDATRSRSLKGYGTISYIAPEGWRFEKNTVQMDIYSMGIVFYELAMLKYPYDIKSMDFEGCKAAHLFSRIRDVDELSRRISPSIASLILRMLEKPTQKRFSNWDEIGAQLNSETHPHHTAVDDLVNVAISKKLLVDTERQRRLEEENKKKAEEDEFCNIVNMQFESQILECLNRFVEEYNKRSSSLEKCYLRSNYARGKGGFSYVLSIPSVADITVIGNAILPSSFKRKIQVRGFFGDSVREESYTPRYHKKDIMCWVEIENRKNLGFNLWLLQTEGIYGDWYILDNKNNLSYMSNKEVKEPFAFSVNALEDALRGIECTSLYTSDVSAFEEKEFVQRILGLLE